MEQQEEYIELEQLKKEKPQEPKPKKGFASLHEDIMEGFKALEKNIGIAQTKAQDYLYGMHPEMKKDKDKPKEKKGMWDDPLGIMED